MGKSAQPYFGSLACKFRPVARRRGYVSRATVNSTRQDSIAAPIRCAKCNRENPREQRLCQNCGAQLFVVCRRCGAVNERANQNCVSCHRHLHASRWHRRGRGLFRHVSPLEALLCVLGLVLLGVLLLVMTTKPDAPKAPAPAPVPVSGDDSRTPDVNFGRGK
jgi:hypothetical protein